MFRRENSTVYDHNVASNGGGLVIAYKMHFGYFDSSFTSRYAFSACLLPCLDSIIRPREIILLYFLAVSCSYIQGQIPGILIFLTEV